MRIVLPMTSARLHRHVFPAHSQERMYGQPPGFQKWLNGVEIRIKNILQTEHDLFIFNGTGAGGLESAIVNFFSPLDTVVCLVMGENGECWAEIADIFGLNTVRMGVEGGRSIDAQDLDILLSRGPGKGARGVCVTHSELSSGVSAEVDEIADVCAQYGVLCLVDARNSLAAVDLQTDRWGVDVVVAATPGGLSMPTGLTFLSVSHKAAEYNSRVVSPRCYWSLDRALNATQHPSHEACTASMIPIVLALEEALDVIDQEGLQNAFRRHYRYSRMFRRGAEAMGLQVMVQDEARASPVSTSIILPDGVDEKKMYDYLSRNHICMDKAPYRLEGTLVSVVHLGHCDVFDISHILVVLGLALRVQGVTVNVEAGLEKAWEVLQNE